MKVAAKETITINHEVGTKVFKFISCGGLTPTPPEPSGCSFSYTSAMSATIVCYFLNPAADGKES